MSIDRIIKINFIPLHKNDISSQKTQYVEPVQIGTEDVFEKKCDRQLLEDIEDGFVDEYLPQEECFDYLYPDEFDSHYHIDLDMVGSDMFRDRELFNPNIDDESVTEYCRYDEDDVEGVSNFRRGDMLSCGEYRLDTDLSQSELPDCVTKPYKDFWDDEQRDRYIISKYKETLSKPVITRETLLDEQMPENVVEQMEKIISKKEKRDVDIEDLRKTIKYLYNNDQYCKEHSKINIVIIDILDRIYCPYRKLAPVLNTKVQELALEGNNNVQIRNYLDTFLQYFKNNTVGGSIRERDGAIESTLYLMDKYYNIQTGKMRKTK